MSKTFALVNVVKHEIAKDRRGKVILAEGHQPPQERPAGFGSGYSWEDVEVVIDRNHVGKPRYAMLQPQVARVSKIVSGTGERRGS